MKTSILYLFNCFLDTPLHMMFSLLQFILLREYGATPLQITVLVALKPTMAVFSSYWSSFVRPNRHIQHLTGTALLAGLSALFFPIIQSNWLLVACCGAYYLADRAAIPSWMEILRSEPKRNSIVSRGTLIKFVIATFFPLAMAFVMDLYSHSSQWIFFSLALVSLIRIILYRKLPASHSSQKIKQLPVSRFGHVLKTRPDFCFFQLIFFFGGLGCMIMQTALPRFVTQVLDLSYTELALAFALCKGIGFALARPFWSRLIRKINLYLVCSFVAFCAAISVLLIPAASSNIFFLYFSLFIYGMMQAGSQLSWYLSGPMFAGSEDSSPYTGINVMMVGVRGCVGPWIGRLAGLVLGLSAPFYIGGYICLAGTICGAIGSRLFGKAEVTKHQT